MAVVGIVEDNRKIRDLIQRYLDMQEGMECPVAVDSVEEMLDYLKSHDSTKIFDSLVAGASGYLLKHTSLPEIHESIQTLLKGGAPMSPQIARKVIGHFNKPRKQAEEKSDLTLREQDIVNGLVDGLSYKLIADRYEISIDTVRAHIRNIYRKLHVNSKAEVIAKSLRGEI